MKYISVWWANFKRSNPCLFKHTWSKPAKGDDTYMWRKCINEDCCAKQRLEPCGASDEVVWRRR